MCDETNDLFDQVYGKKISINERFPDVTGALRYEACEKLFVERKTFMFRFFASDGTKLLSRHPGNPRKQTAMVREIGRTISKIGVLAAMRGKMMGTKNPDLEHHDGDQWVRGIPMFRVPGF